MSRDELSRLSMRVKEMVSGINSDRLSNTGVSVVTSGFFVFLLGSSLMSLVWNFFWVFNGAAGFFPLDLDVDCSDTSLIGAGSFMVITDGLDLQAVNLTL